LCKAAPHVTAVSPAFDASPLFEPFVLNKITLNNRFVMPGMQRGWAEDGGAPAPRLADYYARRVEGGVALIISESAAIDHPSSTQQPPVVWITESTLPGWQRTVDAVRAAGGQMLIQLWHEGALRHEGGDGPYADVPTISPSGIVFGGKLNGRAASRDDLESLRDAWVRSALMAQSIGAAGVEVHACHGYMLDQFLWAETNRRDDGYGGDDIRARVRFPAEVVAAIRGACGPDFVVSLRFSQWKEANYDARVVRSPEELKVMLAEFRAAGADVIHASMRRFWLPEWEGSDLSLAGWTKSLTELPVITVGSVGLDVDVMDNLLLGTEPNPTTEQSLRELVRRFTNGEFDLVSIGRCVIGDPEWVNKVREGRYGDIRAFRRADLGMEDMQFDASFVAEAHGLEPDALSHGAPTL
jgi:2,4-dienoyl-CoA reductase-like NADH-dependent reductase (Old Yellow Enzyme family)